MTDPALVARPSVGHLAAVATFEEIQTLKNVINPDLSDVELRLVAAYAQKTGLDPIAKQFYPIHLDGKRLSLITSIDGFRIIAERSGQYAGQGTVVYGDNCRCGIERYGTHPEWAEVPIYRLGWELPVARRAYFHEYVPVPKGDNERAWTDYDRDRTWRKMPHVLVAKCSEALGLRVAFPNDLGSLYIAEEMEQAQANDSTPILLGGGESTGTTMSGTTVAIEAAPAPVEHGLPLQGLVYKVGDGVRMVRVPDWAKGKGFPDPVAKIEVSFKVQARRHTALILGDLARHVEALGIELEDTVAMDGRVVNIEWQQGKPPKKEVHDVGRVLVLRGGVWHEAGAAAPVAASEPRSEAQAPDELAEALSGPVVAQEGPDADVDPSRGGSTSLGEDSPDEDEADIDELPSVTTEPAPGPEAASVDVSTAMAKPVWHNEKDRTLDMGDCVVIEFETGKTSSGVPFWHGWLLDDGRRARFEVVMADDEARVQGAYDLAPGVILRIVGTWAQAGGRALVMATALVVA